MSPTEDVLARRQCLRIAGAGRQVIAAAGLDIAAKREHPGEVVRFVRRASSSEDVNRLGDVSIRKGQIACIGAQASEVGQVQATSGWSSAVRRLIRSALV